MHYDKGKGAESKFINGHTNITSNRFIVFGVKGLLNASKNVKNALLFNVLSFMSDKLLTEGHTGAAIGELYLFLTNMTAIEYIRNFMKRVRKKEPSVILSSQNLEDFNIEGIREMTKPLFSIPTHQFLFNAGAVDAKFYMDTIQLEESEYKLIKFPQPGYVCINAVMSDIIWLCMHQTIRRNYLERQVADNKENLGNKMQAFIDHQKEYCMKDSP